MSKCFIDVEAVKTAMDETVQSIESSIKSVEASIKSTEASIRGLQASACKENNYNAAGLAAAHASLNGLQSQLSQLQSQLIRIQETCTKICEAIQNMEDATATILSAVVISALAECKAVANNGGTTGQTAYKWQDTPTFDFLDSTVKLLEYEYTIGKAGGNSKYLVEGDTKGEGLYDGVVGAYAGKYGDKILDKWIEAQCSKTMRVFSKCGNVPKLQSKSLSGASKLLTTQDDIAKGVVAALHQAKNLKLPAWLSGSVSYMSSGMSMLAGIVIDDVIDFKNIKEEYKTKKNNGTLTSDEALVAEAFEKSGAHIYNVNEAAWATLGGVFAAGSGASFVAAIGAGFGGAILAGLELDAITYVASKAMGGPVYTSFVDLCGDTGLAVVSNDDVENLNAVLNVEARCTNVIREQNGMEPLEIQDVETVSFGECVMDTLEGYGEFFGNAFKYRPKVTLCGGVVL